MENQERTIVVKDENGKTLEGEILFTFEANGDDFVLYAIEDQVFAAKVTEENELMPIEEDEWKLVEKIYNEYMEDLEDGEDDE